MKRSGPPQRKTPLARGQLGKRRKEPTFRVTSGRYEFSLETKVAVHLRSRGRCEAAISPQCHGAASHVHHVYRRRPGFRDTPKEALHVCVDCHLWIHGNVKAAEERGWLLRSRVA